MDTNEDLRKQLEAAGDIEELNKKNATQEAKVNELALLVATLEDTLRQKDEQVKKKEALVEEITVEKQKSVRLVEELEEQITSSFDQHHNRLSVIQQERDLALEDAKARIVILERDIETYRVRIEQLELQLKNGTSDGSHDRSSSLTSNLRKSSSAASLPSPPPAIPLPPLPTIASAANGSGSVSPPSSRHASKELVNAQIVEDQEARIRTIEKHLYAEKQLTATLEEALGDLESQSSKLKNDCENWKKKAWGLEDELSTLRKERNSARLSLQAVEEERSARKEAEAARAQLEERMNALNKKKKKSTLNCF
jgi:kinesin family protein 4/21/27